MKIVSTKQFWWRLNHLKRNGGEITVTDMNTGDGCERFQ